MAIRKVGKYWQIDYYEPNGKRKRQNFKKKKDAVAELGKREALKVEGRYLDVKREYTTTLDEALKLYENNFGRQPSFKTAKRFFIANFKKYFGEDKQLSDIRYVDLETYRSHIQNKLTHHKKIRTRASINREMGCLRHILTKAVEWDLIDENPFEKGASLRFKENNQRKRYLTEDEIDRLLDACSTKVIKFPNSKNHVKQMTRCDEHYLRDIVECGLLTGMRKQELLGLKWSQIRDGFIYLRKTKTLNPREIPINGDLGALFKRIRKRQGVGHKYVFMFQGNRIKGVKSSFAAALKRANIEDFKLHDLRHTFASHFVMRGGSMKVLQEYLGHKDIKTTMRYAHLAPSHKREAINLLNGLTVKKADGHKMVTFSKTKKSATV